MSRKAFDSFTKYQAICDKGSLNKTEIQVAIELGCSKSTISNWCRQEK